MDDFAKRFPNLLKELEKEGLSIEGVRQEAKDSGKDEILGEFGPVVLDFLRRCSSEEEALEVIAFLESNGDIDKVHAAKLRSQLLERGLSSFGSKKEPGYYERVGRG